MENLYIVRVVTRTRKVILTETVVAPDEAGARFEADVDAALRHANLKPRDVTVLCGKLGEVAVEKEPEQVRVITTNAGSGS